MSFCNLVISEITHSRHSGSHQNSSHFLRRKGLSVWLDLDHLEEASRLSHFFSVDRWNVLSFSQRDHGPDFKSNNTIKPLARYVREVASNLIPEKKIFSVRILTFPRLFGVVFNPLSVYVARDIDGVDILHIYEVRNTFGDMHSYIGVLKNGSITLVAKKIFHVSPFFPLKGYYRLRFRASDTSIASVMRYHINGELALTAIFRGKLLPMTNRSLFNSIWRSGQYPFRTIISIHFEALKLWLKKIPIYSRPNPTKIWSKARDVNGAEN